MTRPSHTNKHTRIRLKCADSLFYINSACHRLLITPSGSLISNRLGMAAALMEPGFDMNRLSLEIFTILENRFLFAADDPKLSSAGSTVTTPTQHPSSGKVCILSIDAGDVLLACTALVRLESIFRRKSGDPDARIADFFDVAAGSGAGGVLAAMLFTVGPHGRPLFSAGEALQHLTANQGKLFSAPKKNLFRGIFRRSSGDRLRRIFADATLKDTLKPLLISCYDLTTAAPFLFSRADAVETDSYDFTMRDVCAATSAVPVARHGALKIQSLDSRTRIAAVSGAFAMVNPTAAAITHVLNNKQEFPFASSVEDLLVVSLGGRVAARPSATELIRIAGDGAADLVDQAVSMTFEKSGGSNYVRIQSNGLASILAEEVMEERYVESLMFRGKRVLKESNGEKLDMFSIKLVKEEERRRTSPTPTVMIKQVMSPRSSSATASTVMTSTTWSRALSSP